MERDTSFPLATRNINQPPSANDAYLNVSEGGSKSIDLTSLTTDPDNDQLTFSILNGPNEGTASVSGTTLTYTHSSGAGLSDTVIYQVTDPYGGSDTGILSIGVDAIAPTAGNSSVTVRQGATQTIDVSTLIQHPQGEALTVTIDTNPTEGSLSLSGTTFTYAHGGGSATTDSFIYRVTDLSGDSDTGTINISVTVNNAPVAADTSVTALCGYENIDTSTLTSDADGDSLTLTVNSPTNGYSGVSNDGITIYYGVNNAVGSDTFTYTVTDGYGGSDSGTISITSKNSPTADPIRVGFADGAAAATIDASGYVSDPNGDSLTLNASDGAYGTVSVNQFIITYTRNSVTDNTPDEFYYTVTDSDGCSAGGRVIVAF